jgi:PhnB protein
MAMPDGTIAHAEIDIGGSIIMIGDEVPDGRDPSPKTLGRLAGRALRLRGGRR